MGEEDNFQNTTFAYRSNIISRSEIIQTELKYNLFRTAHEKIVDKNHRQPQYSQTHRGHLMRHRGASRNIAANRSFLC